MAEKTTNRIGVEMADPLAGDPCPLLGKCSVTKNTHKEKLPFKECTVLAFKGCGLNPKFERDKGEGK